MCYRGGRGVVPTDGIRPGQMIVKFRWWPRDMATQMCLWHIGVAEPPCEPRQIDLEHLSMSYRRGRPRKSMTCQGSICRSQHRLSSGDAVRRSSLRSALLPFPASSLPRELVSGRHLPLPEAMGWPRPPYRTT